MPPAKKPHSPPKWKPAPTALVKRFHDVLSAVPGIQLRKMFGYPAAFYSGHLFTGLFQDKMIIRLPLHDREALEKIGGTAPFEPMRGRPMREYRVLPKAIVASD